MPEKYQNHESKLTAALSPSEIKQIQKLPDWDLHIAFARSLRTESRQIMITVHHMREIDRRRLWAAMGHHSLKQYCREEFQMSDTDFYRKLSLMKLIFEIPEIEAKIVEGTLNPTSVAQAATHFRKLSKTENREVTLQEKIEIVQLIENKSDREVERELAAKNPELTPLDHIKYTSRDQLSANWAIDQALLEKLSRLQDLLMHALPGDPNKCDLLHKVCDIALEQIDPLKKLERKIKREEKSKLLPQAAVQELAGKNFATTKSQMAMDQHELSPLTTTMKSAPALVINCVINETPVIDTRSVSAPTEKRNYLSVKTKLALVEQANDQCEFISRISGKRCTKTGALQTDHITPLAQGGSNHFNNLRRLCSAHNQYEAIHAYGRNHMAKFVPAIRSPVKSYRA